MTDLVSNISKSVKDVFASVLADPTLSLVDRLTIYNRAPVEQKRIVYDVALPAMQMEFENSPLATSVEFESVFPEPPGIEEYRALEAERDVLRQEERDARSEGERK